MKNSNNLQIVLALAILFAAGAAAVLMNSSAPVSTADSINKTSVQQTGNSFAIKNLRVFDGEQTIESTSVLISNGKIAAISHALNIPEDTLIYDGAGKTLLPGLIDSHTHTYGDAQKDALRFGVTTEMDMFSDWHLLSAAKTQRASLARTEQSDLWSAGTLATAPEGHGTEYGMKIPTLSKPSEADAFVQARVDEGSDFIKIVFDDGSAYGPNTKIKSLTPDITQPLINSAHLHNKKALIHIAAMSQAKTMLTQGADGLMHSFIDQIADQEFIQLAKRPDVFIVPTLSVTASLAGADAGKELAADPQLRNYLTKLQTNALNASFPARWQNPKVLERALASVKLMHEAGVVLLVGTDAGNPSTSHGASMHGELALFVQAGFSPAAALNAATALPAKIFGLADRGRIAVGMRADLFLVDGDPTQNIAATRAIEVIWKNGYRLARSKQEVRQPEATVLPPASLISDFEQKQVSSFYGVGWRVSTDTQMGGSSVAQMRLSAPGAHSSGGALEITGEIKAGFAFPWAGVYFVPGATAAQPINYSKAKELVFWAKGDRRDYSVMAFSASQTGGIPPSMSFTAGSEWQEIRLPLTGFDGLDLTQVNGFAVSAGAPEGEFKFFLDDVLIK